ncbi:hypothetical protein AOE01nite_35420 [Acetobacter oeni]|uniref:Uncharacterized protein n=1 Tax=Acetobacter oeni TaxID=304077 RepID=A0A511XQS4_9PROT|nr:hypothetical protein AA21952_1756 [Acetobacter oeni LMG 21952]GEN65318.1 hypothetical protein AOE01nite_35420 [Acetobacter oeni]
MWQTKQQKHITEPEIFMRQRELIWRESGKIPMMQTPSVITADYYAIFRDLKNRIKL